MVYEFFLTTSDILYSKKWYNNINTCIDSLEWQDEGYLSKNSEKCIISINPAKYTKLLKNLRLNYPFIEIEPIENIFKEKLKTWA